MNFRAFLLLTTATLAAGCTNQAERFQYVEEPVEVLYNQAVRNLEIKRYSLAINFFDEVERQHPYSVWARRAMLMSAYAHYQSNDYQEAIAASERFIALHPGNKDTAYAYYLIAVSHYEQILDVGRDQEQTREALASLQEVIRRYPGSPYSRDARLKLDLVNDHLAGKELAVGRWYLRQHHYVAALNRFQTVIDRYQTTSHVPEALHRMVEAYTALGLTDEAQRVAAVLGHNYPGVRWYEDAYKLAGDPDYKRRNLADDGEDGDGLLAGVFDIFR